MRNYTTNLRLYIAAQGLLTTKNIHIHLGTCKQNPSAMPVPDHKNATR